MALTGLRTLRLGKQTSVFTTSQNNLVKFTDPKGYTGGLPLCSLIFSWLNEYLSTLLVCELFLDDQREKEGEFLQVKKKLIRDECHHLSETPPPNI